MNGKSILITGGTGSFGSKFTELILKKYPRIKRLIIFSRDEQKHFQMEKKYPEKLFPSIRYFIGDVRDYSRLVKAFEGVDIVIHAAAMKHVHIAEYNPMECIKTNVNGAQNVIEASLNCGVKHVIALSTDKAAAPINLYGATKLTSDKLFTSANLIKGNRDIRFSVVRYGNVIGSNGSVMPFFLDLKKNGSSFLPITDKKMTRFNISLEDGCKMVFFAIENALGGEIFVPKIPSYHITDVAKAIAPNLIQKEIGLRPGEKLHEEMITVSDSINTIDIGKYYVILPSDSINSRYSIKDFVNHYKGSFVPKNFSFNSGENDSWETVDSLRTLIKTHIDKNFTP